LRLWKLLIPVGIVSLLIFIAISFHRFIDPDEGFYLLASRLVYQHKLPYVDFFYTQAPLLPYVYGLWLHIGGESWLWARSLSAGLTAALATLVYFQVCSCTRKWALGMLAVCLFAANSQVFAWMPITKTYALSSVLLFSSYVAASRFSSRSSKFAFALAALLFGLSVEVRAYFIAVLPIFLLAIFRNSAIREKKTAICYFAAGFALAMLPSLYFFSLNPALFSFDNLGYHSIRSSDGLIGNFGQKLAVFLGAAILPSPGDGPQLGLLCLAGLIAALKTRATTSWPVALQIAAVLALVSLLPTPVYLQYFCVVVPFLVTGTICAIHDLLRFADLKRTRTLTFAGLPLLAIYLAAPVNEFRSFVLTGTGFGVPGEGPANWNPKTVLAVSKTVDRLAAPGEEVMSFWPGYLFGTKAAPFPGFESDSGLACAARLTGAQRTRYHIVSRPQVEADIAAHIPRIVVLGNQEYWHDAKQPYVEALLRSGYHRVRLIEDTSIYTL